MGGTLTLLIRHLVRAGSRDRRPAHRAALRDQHRGRRARLRAHRLRAGAGVGTVGHAARRGRCSTRSPASGALILRRQNPAQTVRPEGRTLRRRRSARTSVRLQADQSTDGRSVRLQADPVQAIAAVTWTAIALAMIGVCRARHGDSLVPPLQHPARRLPRGVLAAADGDPGRHRRRLAARRRASCGAPASRPSWFMVEPGAVRRGHAGRTGAGRRRRNRRPGHRARRIVGGVAVDGCERVRRNCGSTPGRSCSKWPCRRC